MTLRVSVITPAYNVAPYLDETIRSVLQQTLVDFEYLVVDDGSTDETLHIAESWARRDDRIRVIARAHRGSGAARNAGLAVARGHLVAFLDGDDTWDADFLEFTADRLDACEPHVVGVFCHSRLFRTGQANLGMYPFAPGEYDLRAMLVQWNPARNGSALLLRRRALAMAGTFDEVLPSAVDLEMWLRLLAVSPDNRLLGLADVRVNYRIRPDSISADSRARFDGLHALAQMFGAHLSRWEKRCYAYPIKMGLRHGRPAAALRLVRQSFPFGTMRLLGEVRWTTAIPRLLRAGARRRPTPGQPPQPGRDEPTQPAVSP